MTADPHDGIPELGQGRTGPRIVTIGVMADPGLPEKLARSLAEDLPRQLSRHVDSTVDWNVDIARGTLPLTEDGNIPLIAQAPRIKDDHRWDYLVYLTDLPRSHGPDPMVCELSSCAGAVLVSLPALGAWRLRARTRRLVVTLISSVLERSTDFPSPTAARQAVGHRAVHRVGPSGNSDIAYVTLPGRLNRTRLLAGMVRNNRPGRLLPALSGCIAAAAATGAFGIFYTTMWNMADALHPGRLTFISLVVIAALSVWLILHNGLWVKSLNPAVPGRTVLDNASTVITVFLSVALMYLVLYTILLCGAVTVIAADYLESQLGHPVTLLDYAQLSWLAASLGTMAGALGSNFDSDHAIREATYSRRAHQRRRLAESHDD